jgi:hypothetical protein
LIDQRADGARPDILAANEPQPVEPLLVGQPDAVPTGAHAAPRSGPRIAHGLAGHNPNYRPIAVGIQGPAAGPSGQILRHSWRLLFRLVSCASRKSRLNEGATNRPITNALRQVLNRSKSNPFGQRNQPASMNFHAEIGVGILSLRATRTASTFQSDGLK